VTSTVLATCGFTNLPRTRPSTMAGLGLSSWDHRPREAQGVLLRYLARDSSAYCFRPCDSEEKRRSAAEAERVTPVEYGNARGTNRVRNPRRKSKAKSGRAIFDGKLPPCHSPCLRQGRHRSMEPQSPTAQRGYRDSQTIWPGGSAGDARPCQCGHHVSLRRA